MVHVPSVGYCPKARKKKYETKALATLVVANARFVSKRYNNLKRKEQRVYQCPNCKAWHTTSKKLPIKT